MSVLSLPRIYFTGFMCWDPATGNNNDYFPTYDDEQAALNWDFFKQFKIDITRDNFQTTFRPWAINTQTVDLPPSQGGKTTGIPGEWDYFGGNAAYFVQYTDPSQGIDRRSLVTGGLTKDGPVKNDPLIGQPITLLGDPFGDPQPKPPGRLIDNNPVSVYSAQVYYNSMTVGGGSVGFSAPREQRMQSRFINFTRNFNLAAAGGASVTWQACFAAGPGLKINVGNSGLLAALQGAITSGQAKGIMVRFNTYLNLYFQNGYFNGFQPRPKSSTELPAAYAAALKSGNLFSNPCYSRVVGTIGPWYADELSTCPEGRYLASPPSTGLCNPRAVKDCWDPTAPAATGAPSAMAKSAHQASVQTSAGIGGPINEPAASLKSAAQLGVTLMEFNETTNVLSIDLLNTFPEWFYQGEKADFSDIQVGVIGADGTFTQLTGADNRPATLPYAQYAQQSYETKGGVVDLPLADKQKDMIRNGLLAFQAAPSIRVAVLDANGKPVKKNPSQIILTETPLTAQTDQRGIYLNENETATFQISVKSKGKPAPGASVLIVKYNPPDALTGPVNAIPADDKKQVVNITNGTPTKITVTPDGQKQPIQTNAAVLTADANGTVAVSLQAADPGFPVLVFYPYLAGQPQPAATGSFDEVGTAMFTTVRILAYDDAFVEKFVNLWNTGSPDGKPPRDPSGNPTVHPYDAALAWKFIYSNILYLYDMIFPVMLKFVPLGDRQRVEAAIDQVLALISPQYFPESTVAMPITRDLSRGKRTVLELWGGLVKRNYPPQPISKPAPPTA
jgi:hypothetical protein